MTKSSSIFATSAVLVTACFCGFIVWFPLTNSDIWWHLAAGREMVRTGLLLNVDPFSFTTENARWIDLHWLFQLGAFHLYRMWGVAGLLFGKSILIAAAVLLLGKTFPRWDTIPVLTCCVCVVLLFETRYLVLCRPVVVTIFFLSLFLFFCERLSWSPRVWYVPILLLSQIVWTNCQGLFILGPIVFGAYWIEQAWRTFRIKQTDAVLQRARQSFLFFTGTGLLLLAVTLMNPYGFNGMLFPLKLFTRISPEMKNIYARNISENMPLLDLFHTEPRLVLVVIISSVVLTGAWVMSLRNLRISHSLLFLAFLVLAFMAKRNILLYAVVVIPLLGRSLSFLWNKVFPVDTDKRAIGVVGLVFVMIMAGTGRLHADMLSVVPAGRYTAPFRHPEGAVQYLKTHPVGGNIFNSIRHGGYLLWHFFPPKQVFIDGRLIIRSPEYFAEYLTVCDNPELFGGVAKRFSITHVLLPTAIFDRYEKLARKLYRDPGWYLVYCDETSVVFVQKSKASTPSLDLSSSTVRDSLQTAVERKWSSSPYLKHEALSYLHSTFFSLTGLSFHEATPAHTGRFLSPHYCIFLRE